MLTTKRGKRAVKVKYLICKDFSNRGLPEHIWAPLSHTAQSNRRGYNSSSTYGLTAQNHKVAEAPPRRMGSGRRAHDCLITWVQGRWDAVGPPLCFTTHTRWPSEYTCWKLFEIFACMSSGCYATPARASSIYLRSAPLFFQEMLHLWTSLVSSAAVNLARRWQPLAGDRR